METKFYLPELTREEARETAAACVLLVPVATIEQHGPHLPLHTDIDNVTQILLKVAATVNPQPRVLVSAPVWFSFSPFDPQTYPGTIRTRPEVFAEAFNDILESYLRGGFRKILVVNGHGGGTEEVIPRVVRRLNQKIPSVWRDWQIPADVSIVQFCWWVFLSEFAREEIEQLRGKNVSLDWHAGDIETSLQLYLRPELVDMSKARRGVTMSHDVKFSWHDLTDWHRQYMIDGYQPQVIPGEDDGVSGDPTKASRELGEAIFNLAVAKISEFVREYSAR
jgi:creatinine amidohydrolase